MDNHNTSTPDTEPKPKPKRLRLKRRVQIWMNQVWHDITFAQLRVGSIFRMFETDGTQVEGPPGCSVWRALTAPDRVPHDLENHVVDAEPVSL